MPFEFIDNSAPIDGGARKRIRRHVAAGKNAGKTLVRPSRKKALVLRAEPRVSRTPNLIRKPEGDKLVTTEIERQIGDGMSAMSIPVSLRPGFRRLVQRAISFFVAPRHVPELNSVIDDTGSSMSMWVQAIFLDEAYFHCAIAMSVMAMNNLVPDPEDTREALHHVSQSLHMVRDRLSGHDAASDENIVVVIAMIQFERHQGEYRRGAIHIEGLLQMVEMRGGISALTQYKPSLTQKIFRADLEFALYLGMATRLSVDELMLGSTALLGRRSDDQNMYPIIDTAFFRNFREDLQDLLLDTVSLTWQVNIISAGMRQKLPNYVFHDTILLLGYRLVGISPLGELVSDGSLTHAAHLGLTAFLLTFLRRLDYKVSDMPLLYSLLCAAVQQFQEDEGSYELLLWMLFIGNASIFRIADDTWLVPILLKTVNTLKLNSWQDVHYALGRWPWVNTLHNKSGQALWNRATQCQS